MSDFIRRVLSQPGPASPAKPKEVGRNILRTGRAAKGLPDGMDQEKAFELAKWVTRQSGHHPAEAPPFGIDVSHVWPCATSIVNQLIWLGRKERWGPGYEVKLQQWLQPWDEALPSIYETEHFRIIYWTYGDRAIDTTEVGGPIFNPGTSTVLSYLSTGTGIPDVVQFAAYWLERGWKAFSSFPINMPPLQGKLIDVYLQAFGGSWAAGGMHILSTTPRDYLAGTLLHELFHIFQSQYASVVIPNTDGRFYDSLTEGGANLAQDLVIDYQNEYINVANVAYFRGPLNDPRQTMVGTTWGYSYPYNFALFLKYYSEQQSVYVTPYNEPAIGGDAVHRIYQTCHQHGYNKRGISAACSSSPWLRAFCDFSYLDSIGEDLSAGETLLGNFWLAIFMKDLPAGPPDRRFTFLENVEPSHALKVMTLVADTMLNAGDTFTHYDEIPDYAACPIRVAIGSDVEAVQVNFSSNPQGAAGLFQVALIDDFGAVRDVYRTDKQTWSHTFGVTRNGVRIAYLYAVFVSTEVDAQCGMSISAVAATPDLSITRWNCAEGTHYEVDPFAWGWAWMSPDIWLNSQGGASAEPPLAGRQNQVYVRIRNQGNAGTGPFQILLEYQVADTIPLSPAGWTPIMDAAGNAVTLTGSDLAAGSTAILKGNWDVSPSLVTKPIAVRARISCPADPNVHNKRAVTIFGPALLDLDRPITIRRHPRWADPLWDPLRNPISVISRAPSMLRLAEPSMRPLASMENEDQEPIYEFQFIRSQANATRVHVHRVTSRSKLGERTRADSLIGPDPGNFYPVDARSLPPGMDRWQCFTVHLHGPGLGIGFTVVGGRVEGSEALFPATEV